MHKIDILLLKYFVQIWQGKCIFMIYWVILLMAWHLNKKSKDIWSRLLHSEFSLPTNANILTAVKSSIGAEITLKLIIVNI